MQPSTYALVEPGRADEDRGLAALPPQVVRPALAAFLFGRGINHAEFAHLLGDGITGAAVGYWTRPFGDPQRRAPRKATRDRIAALTAGEVPPESFDPPEALAAA